MRKILSFLMCIAMLMTMVLPAVATEGGETTPKEETPPPATSAPTTPAPCSHNWEIVSSTAATCTVDGSKSSRCTLCGATLNETVSATGHSMGSWVHLDASSHKRTCSTCNTTETAAHSLTETVTSAVTCVSAGLSSFNCSCGYSFTKEYPATGIHAYGEWSTTAENHSHTCAVCQKTESGAHGFSERVDKAATCKEEGILAKSCSTCGYTVNEALPKLDKHTYDSDCDPDCNVCGATRTVEHAYQEWRSRNATGHWFACTKCGDQGSFEKHYPGPAATEEKDQICLVCGYVMTPKINHKHDYSSDWTSDETGHWHACSGCEDMKDFKSHYYEDSCDPDCNVCGFKTGKAHSFDGIWHSDEDGHWFVCSVCGSVVDAQEHTAPENPDLNQAQYCTDCGYKIAEATAHIHAFEEKWLFSTASHWQECACGEKSGAAAHIWDEGTENSDGTVTYRCAVCESQSTEEAVAAEAEQSNFIFVIVLAVIGILLVAAVTALILLLKPRKGRFSE